MAVGLTKLPSTPAPARNLAPGWRMVRFGDVVQTVKVDVDPVKAGLERYIAGEHMESENLHITRWGTVGEGYLGPAFHRLFKKGQVLYGSRRTYLKKVALADFDGVCANTTLVLETKSNDLLPELLPFIMLSQPFTEHSVKNSKGSVNPYINWPDIARYAFPLPPKAEQRRIAEILWAADEAVVAAAEASSRSTLFRSASVARAVALNSPRDAASTWTTMRVGEAGEVLLGRQRSPKYQSGRFTRPYLRVANVFDNYLDLSDVLEMDFDERDAERFGLEVGDILLNEGQSRELVGRCAMYNGEIPGCCFQNTLVRFRAGQSVLPRFALYYFQHAFHTGVFAAIASQTTAIAHLGAGRFANLLMPVPPLTEQEVIVARLDQIEANHTAMIQHFGRVRQLAASIREHFIAGRTR